ncbi:hypothetical protein [Enterococcus ratti]|uniref:Uncharacterized protein n=1 Tax=Enterococcus ratti TaxID=150033 RepID=A0A1L8WPM2_9ENTE|nr:hypothetical protein [Enterococcus ratti]OJG82967.1 hypothetical protein RV14_GL001970 [Enterococcus ratti]
MNEKTLLIYGLSEERKRYAESIGYVDNPNYRKKLYKVKNISPFYIDFYNCEIDDILGREYKKKIH